MNMMNPKPSARDAVLLQANREYKSLFGFPPRRDMQRLREGAQAHAGR